MSFLKRRVSPGVELALLERAGKPFPKHAHDEYLLSVNVVGAEAITLDHRAFEAGRDAVLAYAPNQVQSGRPLTERWSFVILYIDPAWLREALAMTSDLSFRHAVMQDSGAAALERVGRGA